MTATTATTMLAVDGISVRFGGLVALEDVTLAAARGAVTGLIGPNGAGKTTLFNVVCGLQRASAGEVRIGDHAVTRLRPHRRARLGMARTFQRLETFGSLTVRENLLVAAEASHRTPLVGQAAEALVESTLARVGLSELADVPVDTLPTGTARLVEVGRALAAGPDLLLLDEPSSGLGAAETLAFGELLVELAADGLSVVLVEHDVELVMRVCSRIYVLDFGRVIAVGTAAEVRADPQVRDAYLGTTP